MAASSETIVLAQLRAIWSDLADIDGSLGEIRGQLDNLESGLGSIGRHLGRLATANARKQVAADRITERLVRIECRLDLREV